MKKGLAWVLALTMLLSLAAFAPAVAQGEAETITWLYRRSEPAHAAMVLEEANKLLAEAMNVKLDINWIEPGDYTDKLNMKMAAGEAFDLAFVCNWVNPTYTQVVGKGALLALNDYMTDEYMPDILAAIPELVWEGVKVNGQVYAIPNLQVMYDEPGMCFNKEVADAAGVTEMIHNLQTEDDLDAVFAKVQEYDPNITIILTNVSTINRDRFAYASVGVDNFTYDVAAKQVIWDKYKPTQIPDYERARRWYEAGYLPSDASTTTMETTLRMTGQLFARYNRQKPGGLAELNAAYGYEHYDISTGERLMSTGGITSTLTGVSVNSVHPELAVKFYNEMYKNAALYNLLVFGIEGQDYNWADETHIQPVLEAYASDAWAMGNQFNAYLKVGQEDGVWEETIEGNASAGVDALVGFVVDRTPVETELAAIAAICTEYNTILNFGLTDDIQGTYDEMETKCVNAGMQAVIDELQKQVETFLANK